MKRILNLMVIWCVALTVVFGSTSLVSAKEKATESIYALNDEEYTDYENPETGEYFRWENTNARSNVKNFTFRIRNYVESSSFKIDGTKLTVYINSTRCVYASGTIADIKEGSKEFVVGVYKSSSIWPTPTEATFYGPNKYPTSKSLGGGFTNGANYYLRVTNRDELPYSIYLDGSGYIYAS